MPDVAFVRAFSLSPRGDRFGVACDADGAFVGPVPLLERSVDRFGRIAWRPRPIDSINLDLGFCYGLPVDVAAKVGGLAAIANALKDGALLRAQIATLHLQLPDLPRIDEGTRWHERRVALAKALRWSGLLKADWDPDRHPRWPAGDSEGRGGEFAPVDAFEDESTSGRHAPGAAGNNASPVSPTEVSANDRRRECIDRCYEILNRPKPRGNSWSDLNANAFWRCVAECEEEAG
ncbi:MAG: hypothetical protein KGL11_12700 [Alphaproteobacteria bacterium]|nr:hypothetical protein [Alphaproteobacteria bacterium]